MRSQSFLGSGGVDSTDSNRIGADCKSSWKGTPTLPSDDACSRNKGQHSEVAVECTVRPLPLHREPRWVLHRDIFKVNTVVEFHVNEHVIIP